MEPIIRPMHIAVTIPIVDTAVYGDHTGGMVVTTAGVGSTAPLALFHQGPRHFRLRRQRLRVSTHGSGEGSDWRLYRSSFSP